ncbi:MAG: GTP cyclohydrolase I, partial [Desulfurococcaceae archaeon]
MGTAKVNKEKIVKGVQLILEGIGVSVDDPDFRETPQRVADFYEELLSSKLTAEDYKYFSKHGDIVVATGIKAYGLCPHHLLPVDYTVYVAYVPENSVVGISKLVRAVLEEAGFPKLQEKYTEDVADKISELTGSGSVMVVVRGKHYCMVMRGVKSNAVIVTMTARGRFENHEL